MKPVKVKNITLGEGRTKICVPLTPSNMEEMEEQLEKILAVEFDLLEWRADYFQGIEEGEVLENTLGYLRTRLPDRPLLFTFRTKEEGGERSIPLADYERFNQRAAASGLVDLVDIELNRGQELVARLAKSIQEAGAAALCSYHDFKKTPEKQEIVRILRSMQTLGADITKIAVMPTCRRDVLALLEASVEMREQYADRPYITMSMGGLGSITRLSGSLTGSALTFAAAARTSAPGQMEASFVSQALAKLYIEE